MLLKNVRLSYPHIFRPDKYDKNDPDEVAKYSAMLIMRKNHPQKAELNEAIKATMDEKWGGKKPSGVKICIRDGAEKADKDGFGDDVVFFNTSNETRPTVIDRDKSPLVESDGRPYAGCYVDATIDFWAQDNQWGKRVNAALTGIQFRADGDAFGGGRPASADEFEDLSDDDAEEVSKETEDFMS